jgi:hypothetical protein
MAAGGPVFGAGSPPEGDYWTEDDLRAMAEAARELADELKPPNKIGHSAGQQLVLNSSIGQPTDGEMPAVGWLDGATFRVEPAVGAEPAKLLCDIKAVPKKAAGLFESGAWRTRSVELSKVTSQTTGKVYDWVVTGLAWLGAKLPAVRTLDDIIALYETDSVELRRVFSKGDVVWAPTDGYESLRYRVSEALNGETSSTNESRFWVRDVADGRALVEDWYESGGPSTAWIVPFTVDGEGDVTVADRDLWTKSEIAWLEAAKNYAERSSGSSRGRADTRPPMPEPKFTDDQRRKFAEATGLEADKVTDEMLKGAGVVEGDGLQLELGVDLETVKLELAEAKKKLAGAQSAETELETAKRELAQVRKELESKETPYSAEDIRKLEDNAEAGKRAEKRLYEMERDAYLKEAIVGGKFRPGQLKELRAMYDAGPEAARLFIQNSPTHDEFVTELGNDSDRYAIDDETKKAYEAELASMIGVAPGDML